MKYNKQGFTLIELLVVVLIVGILAAVALPQYQVAVMKSRYMALVALVENIKYQQEVFYLTNGYYAQDCKELDADLPSGWNLDEENYIRAGKNYIICNNAGNLRVEGNGETPMVGYFFDHLPVNYGKPEWAGKRICGRSFLNSQADKVCNNLGGNFVNWGGKGLRTGEIVFW